MADKLSVPSSFDGANIVPHTSYQYTPLSTDKSIRLAKFFGQDDDGLPCCTLTEFFLNENPVYKALSYTWASPSQEATSRGVTADRCRKIRCQGKEIFVTQNLFDFLVQARQTH